jgi:hypothetical protein
VLNLETAVGSQKSTQVLGAPCKIKKCLITQKVPTNFFISPCTPIPYASFLRPTAVSRLIKRKWGLASLLPEGIDGFKNSGMLNQFLFQAMLAGEIDKENS